MKTLIAFEFKKFFGRKKNLIGILALIIFIIIYIFLNNSLEKQKLAFEVTSCNDELQSVKQALTQVKDEYNNSTDNNSKSVNLKRVIDYYEKSLTILNEKHDALYTKDWKAKLNADIGDDKLLLQGVQQGFISTSKDIKTIQNRVKINEILLSKNIEPILEDCSMTAYNFIKLAGINIVPLILMILLFLFASDSVSNEIDEGTFKLLLTQPLSRNKVMLSKIISYTTICILVITAIFLVSFLGLGLTKGFGSPYYPTEYYTGNFVNAFRPSKSYGIIIIELKRFLLYMIPFYILLIIAIISIAVLISTLVGNSTGAISVSIIVYVTLYIFNSQLRFFKNFAQFIPFTYTNIPNLLSGTTLKQFENKNITYMNGIVILIVTTLICYIFSFILFRKKDIL